MRLVKAMVLMVVALATRGNVMFAGQIDSLHTKAEVQRFMAANFGKDGLIYQFDCSSIPHTRFRAYYLSQGPYVDSILVEDSGTNKRYLTAVKREPDSSCDCCNDTIIRPANYKLENINLLKSESTFHYYTTDIDGNGSTDLIVDAGVIVAVLDKNGGFEGHLLGYYSGDGPTAEFQGYISLPEGGAGLLFREPDCISYNGRQLRNPGMDTIVYRFQGFTRYNRQASDLGISKIVYRYRRIGMIECGDGSSRVEINSDGKCFLKYSGLSVVFSATLDRQRLDELWKAVAYADVKSKNNAYIFSSDHGEGPSFHIFFTDGTVKQIDAWSCILPIEMRYLSRHIATISQILDWQPAPASVELQYPSGFKVLEGKEDECECTYN